MRRRRTHEWTLINNKCLQWNDVIENAVIDSGKSPDQSINIKKRRKTSKGSRCAFLMSTKQLGFGPNNKGFH